MDVTKPRKKGVRLSFDANAEETVSKTKNDSALKRRGTPHPNRLKSIDNSVAKPKEKETIRCDDDEDDDDDDERSTTVAFGSVQIVDDIDYLEENGGSSNDEVNEREDYFDQRSIQVRRPTPHPSKSKSAQARSKSFDGGCKEALVSHARKMSEPVTIGSEIITKL